MSVGDGGDWEDDFTERWYVLDYKLGQKKSPEKKSRRNREGRSSKANTSTFTASVAVGLAISLQEGERFFRTPQRG